ncbi:MAG: type II toxin-antitoxin system Phd/YefM family antitoxin [Caldilineaceae bacterium]|nr:type II toxin-antitoxin system Phd/YefM family antitoxin [Caldilineaceae bacterium]
MDKEYSLADARNNLTAIVRELSSTHRVRFTRRGKPVAVLMDIDEYERLVSGMGQFWQNYTDFRARVDLADLDIAPELFSDARDSSSGREFSW